MINSTIKKEFQTIENAELKTNNNSSKREKENATLYPATKKARIMYINNQELIKHVDRFMTIITPNGLTDSQFFHLLFLFRR